MGAEGRARRPARGELNLPISALERLGGEAEPEALDQAGDA